MLVTISNIDLGITDTVNFFWETKEHYGTGSAFIGEENINGVYLDEYADDEIYEVSQGTPLHQNVAKVFLRTMKFGYPCHKPV